MNTPLDQKIQSLAQWLYDSQYPVFFTGAGISTESGLPDFRGPEGLWTRRDKGLAPKSMNKPWDSVDPNSGHFALVELQKLGKLQFLISQNVDNLHLKSGIQPERLAELHGNMTKLRCAKCGKTVDRSAKQAASVADHSFPVLSTLVSRFRKETWPYLSNTRATVIFLLSWVPALW